MPPAMSPGPKPPERTPLSDGSTGLIERHVNSGELDFTAGRIADGIVVWRPVFHPDPRRADAEAIETAAKMAADQGGFDVRRLWRVKCGQTAGRPCARGSPYRLDDGCA